MLLATGRYETNVTSGNAFARDALLSVMPDPEEDFRLSADGYLVTQVPFYGAVASLDESLGAYRLHGTNAWAQGTSDLGQHLDAGSRVRALWVAWATRFAGRLGNFVRSEVPAGTWSPWRNWSATTAMNGSGSPKPTPTGEIGRATSRCSGR
jgi:hypothetical protein